MRIWNVSALLYAVSQLAACASPTTPSTAASTTPPAASIQNSVNTVLAGVTASINATRSGSHTLALGESAPTTDDLLVRPSITTQCNASGTSCSVQFNESFSQQTPCTGGGYSSSSATLTGVVQGSATTQSGTLNMSVRSAFVECTANGWVTNTSPSIGTSGTLFITGQNTRINLTMSGGFEVTNAPGVPNGHASCVFNGALLQWDNITGTWANSGSLDCGPAGVFRFS
jgi:hypothetical protein